MEQGAFISYSHADAAQVRDLVDVITKELGFPVWYDNNLHGGDHYFSVIAERILNYEYFIFVVSQNSVNSEFCTMELEFAKSEKKKILAVWLEDFMPPPRIRMVISHTHYIRCYALTGDGLRQELKAALLADRLSSDVTVENQPVSERLQEGYKYFVREDSKKKMKYLLQLESQGKYGACFEPESAVLLGMAYELGLHTEKDLRQAEFYYRVAAHKGSLDGEYLNLALQLEQGKADLAAAIQRMQELAEAGSVLAMVYWGDEVYNGRYGVRADTAQAYRWWAKAAALHHPEAQYYMAFGYRTGEVGVKDPLLAMMYAKESEEERFPRAFRIQGFLYRRGEFVEKDPEKAIACYQKAVDLGDLLSINYIGDVEWFRDNFELAVDYYRQAVEHADAGRIKSGAPYYNLGYAYLNGKGVEEDPRKAVDLYLKGAERGHGSCRKWAAVVIHDDIKNPQQQYNLLKKASEFNCRRAEYYLGKLLEEQTNPNYAEALKWFNVGVDKGDVDCMRSVMHYYSLWVGKDGFRNRDKALASMRLFFSLWNANSEEVAERSAVNINIAYYYYLYSMELGVDEQGGKPDKDLSLFYIRKALATEDGMKVLDVYAAMALGYLNGEDKAMVLDIAHGEAIVEAIFEHLERYCETQREYKDFKECLGYIKECCQLLEKHYRKKKPGLFGGKQADDEAARKEQLYRQRGEQVKKVLAEL